jgi:hypothetical protein
MINYRLLATADQFCVLLTHDSMIRIKDQMLRIQSSCMPKLTGVRPIGINYFFYIFCFLKSVQVKRSFTQNGSLRDPIAIDI